MRAVWLSVLALSLVLGFIPGGAVLADAVQLPLGADVPVNMGPNTSLVYDFVTPEGGTLKLTLSSGDLGVSVQSEDRSTSVSSSFSGSGTSSVGLGPAGPGNPYHLRISSQGGAQGTLSLTTGNVTSGDVTSISTASSISSSSVSSDVSSTNASSAPGSTVTSIARSSVNVERQVVVTGGSAAAASGGRIEIHNGRVTVTGGQ